MPIRVTVEKKGPGGHKSYEFEQVVNKGEESKAPAPGPAPSPVKKV